MPALVAGIHVFLCGLSAKKDMDGRDKPGHDSVKKRFYMTGNRCSWFIEDRKPVHLRWLQADVIANEWG